MQPIAMTMGEPAGIGGEVLLKAWRALQGTGPQFFALDDPARLAALAAALHLDVPIAVIGDPADAAKHFARALPVLPLGPKVEAVAGAPSGKTGAAVVMSIEKAVALATSGKASAVVTNPIQKSVLYETGFSFPGHTEFLGKLAGTGHDPVMMLIARDLRVVPVTIHVSLKSAIESLTTDLIIDRAQNTARALRQDFAIARPRLAILGLNPHAGENATMGLEDRDIVAPAVSALHRLGIAAFGPVPPDTAFTERARKSYDAAICLYHDQALIPVKTIDMDGGVNVTLGLSIVRTSPDHGTALDIAGQGIANPGSLIAAIRLAADLARHRTAAAQI